MSTPISRSYFSTMATLHLYRSFDGLVGRIDVPEGGQTTAEFKTVIILDRSGSMGQNVRRLVNNVIPDGLEKLGYKSTDEIYLITFDSSIDTFKTDVDGLRRMSISARGITHMRGAITSLRRYIADHNVKNLRLLTISDGELHDQRETVDVAAAAAAELKGRCNIHSQAIRLFTSSSQPDTRGLASVLQFNENRVTRLKDTGDVYTVSNIMYELFSDDGMGKTSRLESTESNLLNNPWSAPASLIHLPPGSNTIWINGGRPNVTLDGVEPNIIEADTLSAENYEQIMKTKLDYFMDKLRILKVINTAESRESIKKIIDYVDRLDQWIGSTDGDTKELLKKTDLTSRRNYLVEQLKKRRKTYFSTMREIANDDKVKNMNLAQQASYLRQVDTGGLGKALAKRADTHGIDFTMVARREVAAMHAHLNELDGIDDSDHTQSFYSLETALGGIKAVCSLVDDGLIDRLDVIEIIQMLNIVGISCNGIIGNYPDPTCWRLNQIYSGCYISLSDILMHHIQSGGKQLSPPGLPTEEINSVIPLFDDQRIQEFLLKYAPNLLEYTASIGMRRIITGVPSTYKYTLCNGIWKFVEMISKNPSEVNRSSFKKLVESYDLAVGDRFTQLLQRIEADHDETQQLLHIGDHGVVDMIKPLYDLIRSEKTEKMERILRAIYVYEVYQIVKKMIKRNHNNVNYTKDTLHTLLNIDMSKNQTPVTPLFEENGSVKHYDQYSVNDEKLDELANQFWFADYIALIPNYLENHFNRLDEQTICVNLDIPDLRKFKLYAIVQAFMYPTNSHRVSAERSLIIDIGDSQLAEKMVRSYVENQYCNDYVTRLFKKKEDELKVLVEKFVETLLVVPIDKFIKYLRDGFEYRGQSFKIPNESSLGFVDLKNGLLSDAYHVEDRFEKIKVFFLGSDDYGNTVWNNGNRLRVKTKEFKEFYRENGRAYEWSQLVGGNSGSSNGAGHVYRDMPNRHGHHNDFPSYWAMGYPTLRSFIRQQPSAWRSYRKSHSECCGTKYYDEHGELLNPWDLSRT